MEARNQFTFYRSYFDAVSELPKKEQTAVLLAICNYGLNGMEPTLSGVSRAIFTLIRPTLDSSRKKADNGLFGGRPKGQKKTEAKPNDNLDGTEKKATPEKTESKGEKENKKEKEIEIEIENECYSAAPAAAETPTQKQNHFVKPTREEVETYCLEKGYALDVDKFLDYYTANGWKVGRNPMKDWRAAVRNWLRTPSYGYSGKKTPVPTGGTGLGTAELEAIQQLLAEEKPDEDGNLPF